MKFPTNQFVEISVQFLETHAIYANSRQKTFFFLGGGVIVVYGTHKNDAI
jgi:hypothetical protein